MCSPPAAAGADFPAAYHPRPEAEVRYDELACNDTSAVVAIAFWY
jgi:hypothetical protein